MNSVLLKENIFLVFDKSVENKIEYWDPFNEYKDISFFIEKNEYFILGPQKENGEKHLWKFNIVAKNNNKIIMNTIEISKNGNPCVSIEIENGFGKINYINRCRGVEGRLIIKWTTEIIKKLGGIKCKLQDLASKNCDRRNYKNYVPLSLIQKLKNNKTYYEEFDFIPYNLNNQNYKTNKVKELNELIDLIKKISWNEYSIENEKWNIFKKLYSGLYSSPFSAFSQFMEDNCGIFYDILYLLDNPGQPCFEILSKIKTIIQKSIWLKML
jgi:hypothetical protein